MSGGEAAMNAWIAKVRKLAGFVDAVAPDVAQTMRESLASTIAAGTTPDGRPWKPRVDGSRALQGAAAALAVRPRGTIIAAEITGPEAFHHHGTSKDPQRQILPVAGLPDRLAEAVRIALVRRFQATMGVR